MAEEREPPPSPTSVLNSEQLNFLVFRYLQESGFTHSAFALGYEAGINKTPIDGNLIPPGCLISLVQKGLQYIELEANFTSNDDLNVDDGFSFLQPLDLITKDVYQLQQIIKERKERHLKELEEKEKGDIPEVSEKSKERQENKWKERDKAKSEKSRDRERVKDKEKQKLLDHNVMHVHDDNEDGMKVNLEVEGAFGGPEPMDIAYNSSSAVSCEIYSSDVTILEGHTSEVCCCAWSPTGSLLASGSGDSTARIWTIPDGPCGSSVQIGPESVHVLKHFKGRANEKCTDVTTLDWNAEGSLLATGSYDGLARVWNRNGELQNTLNKHKGPIFSLKWNKRGDYLLTGSVDMTAIVWDAKTGECAQQFELHSAPTLDVDWRNNSSFATGSTDSMIFVCEIGHTQPIKCFSGHQSDVNAIKWNATGSLLASCSDDGTAKIWSLSQDKYLHDLKGHSKEIYTIRWSPTGMSTNNPNARPLLASASFDTTLKLWDVERGCLLHSLDHHKHSVYGVAFSPNGEYLASGSVDQSLYIWSLKEGRVVKTYTGGGGIFEICWNKEGNRLAACFSDSTLCIMDFRM